jgi:Family of unknown function (DUF5677)
MPNDVSLDGWLGLNDQLIDMGRKVLAYLSDPERGRFRPNLILLGFARKAIKTLEGIQLPTRNDAWEEAQVLTRVAFEVRATFDCFCLMVSENPADACRRVFDALMLSKMEQTHNYNNEEFQKAIDRPSWEAMIEKITSRYTPAEVESLKRNGFTGLSIEQRCQKAVHNHVYQIMYRNLSRNVHATDFVEQLGEWVFDDAYVSGYRHVRNCTVLYLGNWSVGGIIIRADIDGQFEADVAALLARQEDLMADSDSLASPGQ